MCVNVVVVVAAFFSILHSWLNAFAEMLRFADRLFYKVCFMLCRYNCFKHRHSFRLTTGIEPMCVW